MYQTEKITTRECYLNTQYLERPSRSGFSCYSVRFESRESSESRARGYWHGFVLLILRPANETDIGSIIKYSVCRKDMPCLPS